MAIGSNLTFDDGKQQVDSPKPQRTPKVQGVS